MVSDWVRVSVVNSNPVNVLVFVKVSVSKLTRVKVVDTSTKEGTVMITEDTVVRKMSIVNVVVRVAIVVTDVREVVVVVACGLTVLNVSTGTGFVERQMTG